MFKSLELRYRTKRLKHAQTWEELTLAPDTRRGVYFWVMQLGPGRQHWTDGAAVRYNTPLGGPGIVLWVADFGDEIADPMNNYYAIDDGIVSLWYPAWKDGRTKDATINLAPVKSRDKTFDYWQRKTYTLHLETLPDRK